MGKGSFLAGGGKDKTRGDVKRGQVERWAKKREKSEGLPPPFLLVPFR